MATRQEVIDTLRKHGFTPLRGSQCLYERKDKVAYVVTDMEGNAAVEIEPRVRLY